MQFSHALARIPGDDMVHALRAIDRGAPDPGRARAQHASYVQALESLGVTVRVLEAEPGHPDACFVEDTAVVLGEVAVITRPGAPSRDGEQHSIARALDGELELRRIEGAGTVDGGDIMLADKVLFIGLSERTNRDGAEQLAAMARECGIEPRMVEVPQGLHLKTGVNWLGGQRLLCWPEYGQLPCFAGWEIICTEPRERGAANVVPVNGCLLVPAGYPRTTRALERAGLSLRTVDIGEFEKADGGLSCLSLRYSLR